MSTVHCFTSFSFSYLSRARVLASTVKRHNPNWTLWALVVDKEPEGFNFDPNTEDFDRIVYADSLGIPDFEPWLFQHNVVEACTAVKGTFLAYLLETEASKAVYLDPDIAVFTELTSIESMLDRHDILLTPHQLVPETEIRATLDNEVCALNNGIYNLGFVAANNSPEGRKFGKWWAQRLLEECFDDVNNGVFTDQRWCNLVPALFPGHHLLRDPGCNVASWNLSNRDVKALTDQEFVVNDHPLKFYHFTKLGPIGDTMTRRYAGDDSAVFKLWNRYKEQVASFAEPAIPDGYWHYGRFKGGELIPDEARQLFRRRKEIWDVFSRPYDCDLADLAPWLEQDAGDNKSTNI